MKTMNKKKKRRGEKRKKNETKRKKETKSEQTPLIIYLTFQLTNNKKKI